LKTNPRSLRVGLEHEESKSKFKKGNKEKYIVTLEIVFRRDKGNCILKMKRGKRELAYI